MYSGRGYPLVVFEMNSGNIDHVGIATNDLDSNSSLWTLLGFKHTNDEVNSEQGVKIRFFESQNGGRDQTRIELLEPLNEESPIYRFIQKKGEGIQQIAISVNDIEKTIEKLKKEGIQMINEEAVDGSSGSRIAFIHPKSAGGVLIELVEHTD